MGLLEKFEKIEIKPEARISDDDLMFCETHQQGYDDALMTLRELKAKLEDAAYTQRSIFGALDSKRLSTEYIGGYDGITASKINDFIEGIHDILIRNIVEYFNSAYTVCVHVSTVKEALLPKQPEGSRWDRDAAAERTYHVELQTMRIHYDDIVSQIMYQLGGRTFSERALDELKEKCHKAAWNTYRNRADYEVKNDTIRFTSYACKFKDWGSNPWEVTDSMRDIPRGVAYFETGSHKFYPPGILSLLQYGSLSEPVAEF